MFEAYGIRVSSRHDIWIFRLIEFVIVSQFDFLTQIFFSAAVAEGSDWQAAAGGTRGAASCAWHLQENKWKERHSYL